jgi:hypothetical protein
MVQHIQSQYLKQIEREMPRRKSARENHPNARLCSILTNIGLLLKCFSMKLDDFIEADLCCFFAGKIIDEIYIVMRVEKSKNQVA